MNFVLTRVTWPLVMGLVTFVAVWLASRDVAMSLVIAVLPTILGFINVFRAVGYAVAGLAVIYAVYVFATPATTRARIAAGASNTVERVTSRPNAAESPQPPANAEASTRPASHRRHHHVEPG